MNTTATVPVGAIAILLFGLLAALVLFIAMSADRGSSHSAQSVPFRTVQWTKR